MTKSDILKRLFSQLAKGNHEEALSAAWDIIEHERHLGHRQVANELAAVLEQSKRGPSFVLHEQLPLDPMQKVMLVDKSWPNRSADDVMLSPESRARLDRILLEYRKRDTLHRMRLPFKSKLLFCGPPGTGKTVCAEAIAGELGLPLLYANFDAIVSSYLGETASNLRKVFDAYQRYPSVLFFDEVDAIGKSREDRYDVGELKRVVNSFLQLMDRVRGEGLIISATNHPHILDRAIWRRFDEVLFFSLPTVEEIAGFMRRKLRVFGGSKLDLSGVAERLVGLSYADVERVCIEAAKTAVLEGLEGIRIEYLHHEVDLALARAEQQSRSQAISGDGRKEAK